VPLVPGAREEGWALQGRGVSCECCDPDILEKRVEDAAIEEAKKLGVKEIKLSIAGHRSWPDRLFFAAVRRLLFVEYKRPGEEPRKDQARKIRDLRALGFKVEVISCMEEARRSVRRFARQGH